ncbi:ABC transporter permease [Propylenella binzhouense]|uniref:ABC transporter permease n=1 Tax=Propylenella binzhouense TaxID=2555902 RepID=A0A964T188_9HYPH|nr:ABC transporter permease [Propylenella binzhouense]MYZ46435.1 ABC transporter permease [Propylenella binzhouense]
MSDRRFSPLRRLFLVPAAAVLCFMLLPMTVVVLIALGESATYEFPPRGLTLHWFSNLLHAGPLLNALFLTSLPLALTVAAASLVVGTLAAVGLTRGRFLGRSALEVFFLTPVVFPQILLGVALFLLFARANVPLTLVTLGIGHVVICTPYVIRAVLAGIGGIDPRIEEAARNLGAPPARAFMMATLPLLRSSMLSGAVFAFIVSFSDVNIALFLSAGDTTTLPIRILAEMEWNNDPTIAAAATLQVSIISVLLILVQRFIGTVRA